MEMDIQIVARHLCKNVNILRTQKGYVMKYTTFCRGINWDCLASLKKIWNINNIENQLDATITAY